MMERAVYLDWLLARIRVEERGYLSPCWIWTRALDAGGYALAHFAGLPGTGKVHRSTYENITGPIPDGLQIDHLCRVRSCVNPLHLEPVTAGENTRRAVPYRVRMIAKDHCSRGHAMTPENTKHGVNNRGYRYRFCAICRRATEDAKTARRRLARQAQRLTHTGRATIHPGMKVASAGGDIGRVVGLVDSHSGNGEQ